MLPRNRPAHQDPQLSGNLQVDPEIHLPSVGMDVDIVYFYNSSTLTGSPLLNGPYGTMRTIKPSLRRSTLQWRQQPHHRAGQRRHRQLPQQRHRLPQTPGVLSTVVQDNVDGLLIETTPQGLITAYPLNPQGYPVSVSYIQDAAGNRQTCRAPAVSSALSRKNRPNLKH